MVFKAFSDKDPSQWEVLGVQPGCFTDADLRLQAFGIGT